MAAVLHPHDLVPGSHDRLLTLDTHTHLEWLDLTATLGLSYNETGQSPYVTRWNFRFATAGDLVGLYTSAGLPDVPAPSGGDAPSEGNLPGVDLLLALLGCTTQCVTGEPAGQGWIDMREPTMTGYAFYQGFPVGTGTGNAGLGEVTIPAAAYFDRELPPDAFLRTQTASFLVRDQGAVVPEPDGLLLLFTALGCSILVERQGHRPG